MLHEMQTVLLILFYQIKLQYRIFVACLAYVVYDEHKTHRNAAYANIVYNNDV